MRKTEKVRGTKIHWTLEGTPEREAEDRLFAKRRLEHRLKMAAQRRASTTTLDDQCFAVGGESGSVHSFMELAGKNVCLRMEAANECTECRDEVPELAQSIYTRGCVNDGRYEIEEIPESAVLSTEDFEAQLPF